MIAYFVDPRPDELFYSMICRYKDHTLSNHHAINRELFGAGINTRSNIYYPHRLGNFHNLVGKNISLGLDHIIGNHTILAQYFRFVSPEKIESIKKSLIENKPLNLYHGIKNKITSLKYCPECLKEDLSIFDEPYWHLSHNANEFIRVCIKHNCHLENWFPPYDNLKLAYFQSAKALTKISTTTRFNDNSLLLKISQKMVDLLHSKEPINKKAVISAAVRKGIVRNSKSFTFLIKEPMNEFRIEIKNLDTNYSDQFEHALANEGFLKKVFSGHHPLLFVLLECLIEKLPDTRIQIKGPFVCINKICPNFDHSAFRPENLYDHALILYPFKNVKSIYCKDCGMIYRANALTNRIKRFRRIAYGKVFISRVKHYLNNGYAIDKISKTIDTQWNKLRTLIRCDFKIISRQTESFCPDEFQKIRFKNRLTWRRELTLKSFISISESRKKLDSTYQWLKTYDNDWLKNYNKVCIKRKEGKTSKIKLAEEDNYYRELLEKRKKEFFAADVKTKFLKTFILQMPEFVPIREKYKILPKCVKFLNENCESSFDYKMRRLKWYIQNKTQNLNFGRSLLSSQFNILTNELTAKELKKLNQILEPVGLKI